MKPPPFEYHDPASVSEALALLGRLPNARVLAGGQSLMPMLAMRFVLPDHVIDLNRIDALAGIRRTGDALEIGAMTRQSDIERSALVRASCPLMHEAILQVGHRQTRNRGTLGGSLAHLDPAAELATVASALDASVRIAGATGGRELAFAGFAQGYMSTALAPDELLVAARFPLWREGHGAAFVEFSRRHGDFALVCAAALVETDPAGRIERAALAIGGATAVPVRMPEVEAALAGDAPTEARLRAQCERCRDIDALEDVHAGADYRRHLAAVLARRALAAAIGRAAAPGGTRGTRA